ncbi:hypothetical protein CLCR_10477 [Cladophialophora carrionii]|uniref:Mid2 domain-containing protein n=1 Tax=Cladophialophora carrionii TaxID=86049 RepID=A0A1C1CXB1_9EURO|nr:hypothetical protein CLCR_10477 [Cladophialophora carrionii]
MIERDARTSIALQCALYLFLGSVFAQDNRPVDPNNHFISPPLPGPQANVDPSVFWSNQNWTVGVQQSIDWNWITNHTNLMITLQQEGNPDSVQARTILDCPEASTTSLIYWDGDVSPIDLNNGSIAYLAAWDCDQPDATPLFFSHYINLTEPAVVTTSSSSTPTTSSPSSTRTNAAPVTSSTPFGSPSTPTPTPTPTPSTDDTNQGTHRSSSDSAALGGGIGGGIGGALVLIALVGLLLFWRRGNKNKAKRNAGPSHEMSSSTKHDLLSPDVMYPSNPYQYAQHGHGHVYGHGYGPTEMPGGPTTPRHQQTKLASSVELESTSHSGGGS